MGHCEGFVLYPNLIMKVLALLLAAVAMLDLALAVPDFDAFPSLRQDSGAPTQPSAIAPTTSPTPTPDNDGGDSSGDSDAATGDQAVGTASQNWASDGEGSDLKCYVPGQCQEYSINFIDSDNPDTCGHHCRKENRNKPEGDSSRCNWWSWEPVQNLCVMFSNCSKADVPNPGPDTAPCERCISGQGECPARACYNTIKCKGIFIDSFADSDLRKCISACATHDDCGYYTYEKTNSHCVLYEDCNKGTDGEWLECNTCFTGERSCGLGFLGTTLEGFGFESQEGHAYDLDRKFSAAMDQACFNSGDEHVIDDEVAGCVTFGVCARKQVFRCDAGYAFDKRSQQCENIRDKALADDHIMCEGKKLESTAYYKEFDFSNRNA